MKKHNLLKVLMITFLIVAVLSWIIPLGSFTEGKFESIGTMPVGLTDLFRMPVITFGTFVSYGVLFLMIGALYGILGKTGVYDKCIDKIVKKFKSSKKTFLFGTVIVLALLGSLTGLSTLLFVFVPFLAAILLLMGYSKIVALSSTVGSILVGTIGSTYGFSGSGYVINQFSLSINDSIIAKFVLLAVVTALFIIFIGSKIKKPKGTKKTEALEEKEILFYNAGATSKKSSLPFILITIVFVIFAFVGMYNWYYALGIDFFQNMHTQIVDFTIKGYPIFGNLLGGFTQLGFWGTYDLAVCIFIFTVLISWLYNIKVSEYIDGFKTGAKKMLPVAFYAVLANIIFTVILNIGDTASMPMTIADFIANGTTKFNVAIVTLISLVGSLFYNDFYYVLQNVTTSFQTYEAVFLPVAGILIQAIYSLCMLFLPTSVILIAGLKYFDISYNEWMKHIWKYVLQIFAIIMIIVVILVMFI